MKKIKTLSELDDAINILKFKKAEDEKLLKEMVTEIYENTKPINLIKNLFKESIASQNIKNNLLNTSVGFGAGYLSKLLFQGVVRLPFKNLLGSALMMSVENLIAKNPSFVGVISSLIMNNFNKEPKKIIVEEMEYENQDIHRETNNEQIDLETIY